MDAVLGHFQNADQIAYWNGPAGQHWVERQAAQDALLAPISDALIDRARIEAGERVIDISAAAAERRRSRLQRRSVPPGLFSASMCRRPCWPAHKS